MPHSLVHLSFGNVQPLLSVKLYEQVEETGIHCQGQAIKKWGGEGYYVAASVVIESHLGGARQFRGIAGEGREPSVWHFIHQYMAFHKSKLGETQNIPFALFESKIWAIIETAEKIHIVL